MKTIFYLFAVAAASIFMHTNAFAQHHQPYKNRQHYAKQQSFYYYPQSNVYYSCNQNKYIYSGRNGWIVSQRLPRYIRLKNEPRVIVNHYGFDVWNDNHFHVAQYRRYANRRPELVYAPHEKFDNGWRR